MKKNSAAGIALACIVPLYLSSFGFPGSGTARAQEEEIQKVVVTGQREEKETPDFSWLFDRDYGSGPTFYEAGGGGGPSDANKTEPPAEKDTSTCPKSENPVILSTGEKYKDEPDFISAGEYGLSLARMYRSKQAKGTLFGRNWLSTLDVPPLENGGSCAAWTINDRCVGSTTLLTYPDGTQYKFKYGSGDAWDGLFYFYGRGNDELIYDGSYWTLRSGSLTMYYDPAGKILSVSDDAGARRDYTYDAQGRLIEVSNTTGQRVQLFWGSNNRVSKVRNSGQHEWNYEYDKNSMLVKATAPDGSFRQYHYEDVDTRLLTGISINGVRYSTYSYYADGRVRESGLTGGEEKDVFVYGTDTTTKTDALGQETTYTFASILGEKKLTRVSRAGTVTCGPASAETGYDANGYVSYMQDWKGTRSIYRYDPAGRLLETINGSMSTVNFWSGDRLLQTEYRGFNVPYSRVSYTYHSGGAEVGRVASITVDDLKTGKQKRTNFSFSFYPSGTIASRTDSTVLAGSVAMTVTSYDEAGNIVAVTNPLGQQQSWSGFDGQGHPARMVDINGVATSYSYDPKGNVTSASMQLPSGARTTTYAYHPNGKIERINFPDGRIQRFAYNAAMRLEGVGDAQNNYVRTTVDMATRTVRTSSPRHVPGAGPIPSAVAAGEFSSTVVLDTLGRPFTRRGNNGQNLQYQYDANGNVETTTDAAGRITRNTYDALNRLLTSTAPDGGTTTFTYDGDGRRATVTDPRGLITSYVYNGFGDPVKVTSPDTGITTYGYDAAGRLETKAMADGRTILYQWDALGRLGARSSNGVVESFAYDEGSYGKGKLSRMNDRSGETRYSYGPGGELQRQTNTVSGKVYDTQWEYDSAGRLVTMTYPSGLKLQYSYNGEGQVSVISSNVRK